MVSKKKPTKFEQCNKVIDWATQGRVINAGGGYHDAVANVLKFDACPCDLSRDECPCRQSVEEVKKQGHCKCHLFWSDYEEWRAQMLVK